MASFTLTQDVCFADDNWQQFNVSGNNNTINNGTTVDSGSGGTSSATYNNSYSPTTNNTFNPSNSNVNQNVNTYNPTNTNNNTVTNTNNNNIQNTVSNTNNNNSSATSSSNSSSNATGGNATATGGNATSNAAGGNGGNGGSVTNSNVYAPVYLPPYPTCGNYTHDRNGFVSKPVPVIGIQGYMNNNGYGYTSGGCAVGLTIPIYREDNDPSPKVIKEKK